MFPPVVPAKRRVASLYTHDAPCQQGESSSSPALQPLTAISPSLTRRAWLKRHATQGMALAFAGTADVRWIAIPVRHPSLRRQSLTASQIARAQQQAIPFDPGPLEALTQQAVEAARTAGASYADARFTRSTRQWYDLSGKIQDATFTETVGLGVRVLVQGYWGFAASPRWTSEEAGRLARDAVAQAAENAKGVRRTVELSSTPVVKGRWATPIRIDPFLQVPIEEKLDFIHYWKAQATQVGVQFLNYGISSSIDLRRQERVLATSDGTVVSQTIYETGGNFVFANATPIQHIAASGQGWELFLDAQIPDQFAPRREEFARLAGRIAVPAQVGRYTVICDGVTMASLVDQTLGVATQLDRALGYEANASGTSFLDDPLRMVGTWRVAPSVVTVTANRSVPTQLATVQWDAEGVVPPDTTLIKDGVLVDFQTTREQAGWLAPYYQKHGRAVQSNGCANAESAHYITLQHPPNLALRPSASDIAETDLIADVQNGLYLQGCIAYGLDAQANTGLLGGGSMQQITNGRLGAVCHGGTILFSAQDLWKNVTLIGGRATQGLLAVSSDLNTVKGEPAQQVASHTVTASAAMIVNQPLIHLWKKV